MTEPKPMRPVHIRLDDLPNIHSATPDEKVKAYATVTPRVQSMLVKILEPLALQGYHVGTLMYGIRQEISTALGHEAKILAASDDELAVRSSLTDYISARAEAAEELFTQIADALAQEDDDE